MSRTHARWCLLGIVLTDVCNLRCSYCRAARDGRRYLRWATLRPALDALLPHASDDIEVTFTGGEPVLAFATLRRAVAHIAAARDPQRIGWRILTNGLLLDDEKLSFLDDHHFSINLSFDGVPAAQALRGPGTYGRLNGLLGRLRLQYGELLAERLNVCATVTPDTVAYLADTVRYFLQMQLRSFVVNAATGVVNWPPYRIGELNRQFDAISAAVLRHYLHTGEVPFALFKKASGGPPPARSEWICRVAEGKSPTIDVDGSTYACLRATATYQPAPTAALRPALEALNLGPAHEAAFPDRLRNLGTVVASSPAFRHPGRRYSSYRRCADCEFSADCRICPLASASVSGWDDPYRVPDFLCAFNQVALAHRAQFPCQPTPDHYLGGPVPIAS